MQVLYIINRRNFWLEKYKCNQLIQGPLPYKHKVKSHVTHKAPLFS